MPHWNLKFRVSKVKADMISQRISRLFHLSAFHHPPPSYARQTLKPSPSPCPQHAHSMPTAEPAPGPALLSPPEHRVELYPPLPHRHGHPTLRHQVSGGLCQGLSRSSTSQLPPPMPSLHADRGPFKNVNLIVPPPPLRLSLAASCS